MVNDLLGLKNAYRGRRCFVVATGPSLAYKDLSFLRNEVTIGLNMSSLLLDQWGVVPSFNVFADKYIIPHYADVYESLVKGSSTKKVVVASACETFPEGLVDESTFFVPVKHPKDVVRFSEDPINEGFWRGKTVAYDALQLAFHLGFDEVNILGMDLTSSHDWGRNGHAFEIQKNQKFLDFVFPDNQSHIIQRGLPGHPDFLSSIVEYMSEARSHFEHAGRRIINDSRSSIDVFTKEDLLAKYGFVPKVVAFVPAKGTSQRVHSKNMRQLGDKALFLHILDNLLSAYTIDEVYLDSESQEIFDLAEGRKHKKLVRPQNMASNKTNGNQLLVYEASCVPDADIYVQALPTGPFLTRETIDKAVFKLIQEPNHDSTFTVTRNKMYLWGDDGKPLNYDLDRIPNSFELQDTVVEAMNLYTIRKTTLLETQRRIGNHPFLLPISTLESIDINTPQDFELAQIIYDGLKVKK